MPLTSQNVELQQVQQVLRSILTGNESREVSGKRVARVASNRKDPELITQPHLTAADGSPEEPLPDFPVLTAHDDDTPRPPARIRIQKLEK